MDVSDYFNYDMDEKGWLDYCKYVERHRQEFTMKKKIQTYESGPVNPQQDPDLPPEVAAAIAAESLPVMLLFALRYGFCCRIDKPSDMIADFKQSSTVHEHSRF